MFFSFVFFFFADTEEELEGELEQHKTDFAKASKTLSASEKSYASVHAQLDSVTPKLNEVHLKRCRFLCLFADFLCVSIRCPSVQCPSFACIL